MSDRRGGGQARVYRCWIVTSIEEWTKRGNESVL